MLVSHHPSWKRLLRACLLLYLIALGVRLSAAVKMGLDSQFSTGGDEETFYTRARNLAHGNGYVRAGHDGVLRKTAYQVPGGPILMAAGIRILGDSPRSIRISAIVISSFSAPLMLLFALEMSPFPSAVMAGLGCAFYPSWVFYSIDGYTEPFFIPFLIAGLWLSARAVRERSAGLPFLGGLAWGCAALVRPLAVPMVVILIGYLSGHKLFRPAVLLALGFLLVFSPWLIRNQIVFGHPVLATEGGETFLGANNQYVLENPAYHGLWIPPWQVPEYRRLIENITDELKENEIEYRVGMDFVRANPKDVPILVIYKLGRWLTPVAHTTSSARYLILASYGGLILLLLNGIPRKIFRFTPSLRMVLIWSFILCGITAVY